jgi:hypothetical protein
MNTKKKLSAHETAVIVVRHLRYLQGVLGGQISQLEQSAAAHPADWSYVGDMQEMRKQLEELTRINDCGPCRGTGKVLMWGGGEAPRESKLDCYTCKGTGHAVQPYPPYLGDDR